ncbi:MAG: recombination-associated protein RdgC [Kiritimatiellales bacterium]
MSFENGPLSFRMFYVPRQLADSIHEQFAEYALGSIDNILDAEIHGWVGPRHLLDREISATTAWHSGYLHLTLCQVQRKIPASLLRAECRIEEMIRMQAEHRDYLNRETKREIKQQVIERLLPEMPPQLKGIDFCYDPKNKMLYASALSEKQLDAFLINFGSATGEKLIPVEPASAAWHENKLRAEEWTRLSFAAEQWADTAPGREFLMWLWFMSETQTGGAELPTAGKFSVMVEGPLLFDQEEQGETAIRKGEPLVSAETRAALLSGKKLKRAKLTLARSAEELWTCTLDADQFVIRGLKLPKTEAIDAAGRFQERMEMIDTFRQAFLGLYSTFATIRADTGKCKALNKEMRQWMNSRPARKLDE